MEAQINELKNAGCQEENIYFESVSGVKLERKEFQRMLSILKSGDTIMVTKLDRFARSSIDAQTTVKDLLEKGIKVNVLNMGTIENTAIGLIVFQIMSAFAEFERNLIVERTQAGKAIAKTREGFKEGRKPIYSKEQKALALEKLAEGYTFKEVCKMTGMSKSLIIQERRKAALL
jgi:DNA invertase Pin-like site-specific DNA recombinase